MIRAALAGDRAALRTLIDRLTPVIQARVARALLRSSQKARRGSVRQEVEDLVQEVFQHLFIDGGRVLRGWDETRGMSLEGYVGLIAEREVISVLRSRRRNPFTEQPTEAEDLEREAPVRVAPEREVLTRQMTQTLFSRLREALSPLGFQVFQLLFCDEQSPEAVCQQLNMSADAVYAWRSRIRKTARDLALELGTERGSVP